LPPGPNEGAIKLPVSIIVDIMREMCTDLQTWGILVVFDRGRLYGRERDHVERLRTCRMLPQESSIQVGFRYQGTRSPWPLQPVTDRNLILQFVHRDSSARLCRRRHSGSRRTQARLLWEVGTRGKNRLSFGHIAYTAKRDMSSLLVTPRN